MGMNAHARDDARRASDISEPRVRRLIDDISAPARPLGDKRTALQSRRRAGQFRTRPPQPHRGDRVLCAKSPTTSAVNFVVRPGAQGITVERTECAAIGPRLVQTMVFETALDFDRWCDAEPARFSDPIVYSQLRRIGVEAFDGAH